MSKCPLIALILLAFYLQTRVTKLCEDINQKLMYENTWANDFKFQLKVTNFIQFNLGAIQTFDITKSK